MNETEAIAFPRNIQNPEVTKRREKENDLYRKT